MLKINQSLIGAWDYWHAAEGDARDEAYSSFLRTLRREKSPDTEATAAGHLFEAAVQDLAEGRPVAQNIAGKRMASGVCKVAAYLGGAAFQVHLFKRFTVGPHDMILHGIADAIKEGTIYDIKYKMGTFHSLYLPGSYRQSSQHPAYLYALPEARRFVYLVSDGEDIYTEEYRPEEITPFPVIATEFIGSLKALGLFEIYRKHWEVEG